MLPLTFDVLNSGTPDTSSMIRIRIFYHLRNFGLPSSRHPQVRVPLNTARACYHCFVTLRNLILYTHPVVLAVQNMDACNAVNKSHEIEFQALEGSLDMMSKGWSGTAVPESFTDDGFV